MSNELNESAISGLSLNDDTLDFLMQDVNGIDLENFQDLVANQSEKKDNDKITDKQLNNSANNSLEDILAELCEKNDLDFTQVSLDKFKNDQSIEPAEFEDVWANESDKSHGMHQIVLLIHSKILQKQNIAPFKIIQSIS